MSSTIAELFGFAPADNSAAAQQHRANLRCPVLGGTCTKTLSDGTVSGVCTLKPATSNPVICCPNRLYDDHHRILLDVAHDAFGPAARLLRPGAARVADGQDVLVFGKGWGHELRLPQRGGQGGYFVDWVLARVGPQAALIEFVAVEVQSIDTTGNYRAERTAYMRGVAPQAPSTAGLNWENVNKRILPQIIYKGHVLRREPLCRSGLYFVAPAAVYERIQDRLGRGMAQYPRQPGAITFRWYDVGPDRGQGRRRLLVNQGQFTTTVDQVALGFTAPRDLPGDRVYELAILAALRP